jgi:hypothetical protein
MRRLVGLQFRFSYKKGFENKVVDALSTVGIHFNAISAIVLVWVLEILKPYQNDSAAKELL